MGTPRLLPACATVLLTVGCASGAAAGGGSIASGPPAADGEVLGQGTVLQSADASPEFCLGGVAESYPPLCSGPEVVGWDWAAVEQWEEASGVRWGTYALQGEWNGESFTMTRPAIPLSLFDPLPTEDPWMDPTRPGAGDEAELLRIQQQLMPDMPEALGSAPANGYLVVTVVYDDGSLQQSLDERFGTDLIAVQSALRPVE